MKKYISYILSLCLLITQVAASEVWVTPTNRFSDSTTLQQIRLVYDTADLPPVRVKDSKLGRIKTDILESNYPSLWWGSSRKPLTTKELKQARQAIGAYGIVRSVQSLWKRTLDSFPQQCPSTACTPMCKATDNWRHQKALTIDTHAPCITGCELNAYYSPEEHKLTFPQFVHEGRTKYTCSSFDTVAHEAGHACLSGMCPTLDTAPRLDHGALHESFGDLTALFTSLELATPTQQDEWLSAPHTGTCMAVDLTGSCLRNPHIDSAVECEEHKLSEPLTRFMCDYMRHQWETLKTKGYQPRDFLLEVQHNFLEAILLNLDAPNILTAVVKHFHNNHAPVEDSYLALLTIKFTTCSIAA